MSRTILSLTGLYLFRKEEASPVTSAAPSKSTAVRRDASQPDDGTVPVEDVRAVATEAALAAAVDASPAVLVSLWAHDRRLHRSDRSHPRRGGW
jgi:hypothetical protein